MQLHAFQCACSQRGIGTRWLIGREYIQQTNCFVEPPEVACVAGGRMHACKASTAGLQRAGGQRILDTQLPKQQKAQQRAAERAKHVQRRRGVFAPPQRNLQSST